MDEQRNTRLKPNALYGPLALILLTVAFLKPSVLYCCFVPIPVQ